MTVKDLFSLDQYDPKGWKAQVDYDKWSERPRTNQVFIHWAGTPVSDAAAKGNVNAEKAQLRSFEKYHLGKGWDGIAYDWAIGQSGTLYRLRGLGRSGAQSGDADRDGVNNNVEGEAILCIVGQGQHPSVELLDKLDEVLDTLGYKELYGHQEGRGTKTSCPGPDLMEFIRDRRAPSPVAKKPSVKKSPPASSGGATKPEKKTDWSEQIMSKLGVWKKGQRGPQVKRIQALINAAGLHSLKEDGIFGSQTENAVEEYQTHFRLGTDGVVGPKTWDHLLTSGS